MCQDIFQECETIGLGDPRLEKRAIQLLETLAERPSASINAACAGWGESLAAYRFFDDDRIKPEGILGPQPPGHRGARTQI